MTRRGRRIRELATREARRLIESLEVRRLLATVNGTAGNDVISVTISSPNIVITVNGTPNSFTDSTNTTIVINAGDGDDTVTVNGVGDNATTINGGIGNDSIIVGGSDYDANIDAALRVNGDAGIDTVQIDDDGDLAGDGSDTATLNSTLFLKPNAATTTLGTVEGFQYFGGIGGEVFNLNYLAVEISATIAAGDGNDSVRVGGGDYDANIGGSVFVNAGAGNDTLEVDDGNDIGNDTYTQNVSFTKDSAVATAVLSQSFVERFEISGPVAAANNTFNINRIIAGVRIVVTAGDGNDTINVGNGSFAANLFLVEIHGDAGTDVINLNDQSDPVGSDVYDVFADRVQKGGSANDILFYDSTAEGVVINGSANADLYNINSTLAGTNVTINAGDGNDTLDGGGPNGGLNNDLDNTIGNTTTFNGQAGTDRLDLDDTGDGADPESYYLSSSLFTKGSGTLLIGTSESYSLICNGGNNSIGFGTFLGNEQVFVNAGSGNDTITSSDINDQVENTASIGLAGGIGTDVWFVNDAADTGAATYNMTSIQLQVTAGDDSGVFTYSTFETINLTAGSALSRFELDSIGVPLNLDLGGGNDTLVAGGGDYQANLAYDLVVAGGAGTDSLVVDNALDATTGTTVGDIMALSTGNVYDGGLDVNYSTFEQLDIEGGPLICDYFVDSGDIPTTINGGTGSDVFWLTQRSGDLDAFGSTLFVNGNAGDDALLLSDRLDTGNDTYRITSTSITQPLAGAFQGVTFTDVNQCEITAGGGNQTFIVDSVAAGEVVHLFGGGGNDTFNFGGDDNIADDLGGFFTIYGDAGTDVVNFNDQASTVAHTYEISNFKFGRAGTQQSSFDGLEASYLNTGSADDTISITSLASEGYTRPPVTVNAGSGNDTINVGDTDLANPITQPVRINAGNGDDTVNIGAGDLDDIAAPIDVSMFGGSSAPTAIDQININDQADAGALASAYTITGSTFTRSGAGTTFGGLNFSDEDRVVFNLNQQGTTITIDDSPGDGANVGEGIVNANGGDDLINVLETALSNPFVIHSGAGSDTLDVNNDSTGVASVRLDADDSLASLINRSGGLITLVGDVVVRTTNSNLTSTGVVDVNVGTLVRPAAGALAVVITALERGYNGGAWNGVANGSFRSSAAAASSRVDALGYAVIGAAADQLNVASVHGVPVGVGDLVVTYTLAGDANLDRTVNFDDLLALAQNYAPTVGGRNWRQGNFDYSTPDTAVGAVGFNDLLALAQNYNTSALVAASVLADPGLTYVALTAGSPTTGTRPRTAARGRVLSSLGGEGIVW